MAEESEKEKRLNFALKRSNQLLETCQAALRQVVQQRVLLQTKPLRIYLK